MRLISTLRMMQDFFMDMGWLTKIDTFLHRWGRGGESLYREKKKGIGKTATMVILLYFKVSKEINPAVVRIRNEWF